MKESFSKLFGQFVEENPVRTGSVVKGIVVEIHKDTALIDAGFKSESFVPLEEFCDSQGKLEIKVGETVDVVLDAMEDGFGATVLSREKAKQQALWVHLEQSYRDSSHVSGRIVGKVKGGLTVEIHGMRAFLPGSLVDVRPVHDTRHLEDQETQLKIIKLDRDKNNIVVSRRAVIESRNLVERRRLFQSLQEGDKVSGVVKNITEYGAFVDLGGIDGLLHITDIAWKRVKHPSDVLKINQKVFVKVLKFDREKVRVSLGLKQMEEDPWKSISARYPEGVRLQGRVTNLTEYGFFVEIANGVEGLVHVSEIDWARKSVRPDQVVKIHDVVSVMVLHVDPRRRRISLGLKQCTPNPWKKFAEQHRKNDVVQGTVKSVTEFGVFVKLPNGIDGLVHVSDVSWTVRTRKRIDHKTGDHVSAVVRHIDVDRQRVSLSFKHLSANPFERYLTARLRTDAVAGEVVKVTDAVVELSLRQGVRGVVPRDRTCRRTYAVGDAMEAYVVRVDQKHNRVVMSLDRPVFRRARGSVAFGAGKDEASDD